MSIEIQCPSCSKRFRVEDRFAGKRVKCRSCGGAIAVPAGEPGSDLNTLQTLAESSAGGTSVEEFSPPAPPEEFHSGRGGDEDLPQGFGAALNAARGRSSNRQFSLAAYPGAAVAHKHLPWLIGLICLGFTIHLLIQRIGQTAPPQWPLMTMAGTAMLLFFVLAIPMANRGLRRASDMLHFDLADGTLWRVMGLFSLPLLLATMLSDSVPGIVCGIAVGILMLMPIVWATFQLHWVEAVVAWMMSSLFFAGSMAVTGGVLFFIGLGVAISATPEAPPPTKVATKLPPKVVVTPPPPATQPTQTDVMPPPPDATTQPVVAVPLDTPPPAPPDPNGNNLPSFFGVPSNPATQPVEAPPQPPVVAQATQPVAPPVAAVPQVRTMPSPIVANVTELAWVGEYQSLLDTDSVLAPFAVLKRTPEAEKIDLLGDDKPTATVSFRKDQAGSDRYVVSPAGDTVVRAVTWPKPGLQVWTVADNKPGRSMELEFPEAAVIPLCFTAGDQVVVHRVMGEQNAIQVFNVKTGQKVREQRTPPIFENGYAVSPDGKTLAVAAKQGGKPEMHLIDIATGRTRKLPIPIAPQWPVTPAGVAFSVDSSRIGVVFEQDGNALAVAWNTASGMKTQEHVYPAGTLPLPPRAQYKGRGLDWLADGTTWLLCGSVVVDVPSGQALGSLRVGGVTNQRVVEGKKVYLEAGADAGVKRIATVELNHDAITKMRANLTPPK